WESGAKGRRCFAGYAGSFSQCATDDRGQDQSSREGRCGCGWECDRGEVNGCRSEQVLCSRGAGGGARLEVCGCTGRRRETGVEFVVWFYTLADGSWSDAGRGKLGERKCQSAPACFFLWGWGWVSKVDCFLEFLSHSATRASASSICWGDMVRRMLLLPSSISANRGAAVL